MNKWIRGLSSKSYISPEAYNEEMDRVFGNNWIYFCHLDELDHPLAFQVKEVGRVPVVVFRAKDNSLSGFVNRCPHRGTPLINQAQGTINRKTIVCPFHGWVFNLSGSIRSIPFVDNSELKDCTQFDLKKVNVYQYHQMIFVNLAPGSLSFPRSFPEFEPSFEAALQTPEDYQYIESMTLTGRCNWKLLVEAFQECFHCPTLHPSLRRDFSLNNYIVTNKQNYSVHQCVRKQDSETNGNSNGSWFWLYPNTAVPVYENVYYVLQINPHGVDQTQLNYRFFANSKMSAKQLKPFVDFVLELGHEDIQICEKIQENRAKNVVQETFCHAEKENGVVFFHQLIRKDLEEAEPS